jgi:hypothetical protein
MKEGNHDGLVDRMTNALSTAGGGHALITADNGDDCAEDPEQQA